MSKKDFAKKDMNFFSEFTASSQKATKTIVAAAFAIVGLIVVCGLACLILGVRYLTLRDSVKDLNNKLSGPEYQDLSATSKSLSNELANKNEYLYALTSLQYNVETTNNASVSLAEIIGAAVPSNTILTGYDISGSTVSITATTFSYYAQVQMLNELQNSDLFADVQLTGSRNNPSERFGGETPWQDAVMNADYTFKIEAVLNGSYFVSYAKITRSGVAIAPYEIEEKEGGSIYHLTDIATCSYNGVDYQLTSVIVNGTALKSDVLETVISQNEYAFVVDGNVKIQLYYEDPAVLEAEAAAAAES